MRFVAIVSIVCVGVALGLFAPATARAQQTDDTSESARAGETWPGDPLVAQIQNGLKQLGYEVSVVDGLMGPNTRDAIMAFQEAEDLSVTGEATDALKRTVERRVFRRSEEAAELWRESRLDLRALGYEPGAESAFESAPAQAAVRSFAEDHWLQLEPRFSLRMHDLIARAARASSEAQVWLCDHYMGADAYAEALDWCTSAAEKDVRDAQYYVGWMHYYGRGTEQSYAAAFTWYRRAARAGDIRAMAFVGLMYRMGRGVARDPDAAHLWYQRAVKAGED